MIGYTYNLEKFSTILETRKLTESFLKGILRFDPIWQENLLLRRFLASELYPVSYRVDTIKELFADQLEVPVLEYLIFLLMNYDIASYSKVTARLLDILEKKYTIVTLKSTEKLPESFLAPLIERLKETSGKKVFLEQEIDPFLLGGVVLQFRYHVWDLSLKGRLTQLKESLI